MSQTFGVCKFASFLHLTCEQEERVTSLTRGSLVWPAMTLAGLVLGAYVYTAWPETAAPKSPTAESRSKLVRTTASVDSIVYELSPTPLLDALISAPEPPAAVG